MSKSNTKTGSRVLGFGSTKNTGDRWSKEDVKILRRFYRNTSTSEVATRLGRTTDSVGKKASRLGINKYKKYLKTSYFSR